VEGRRSCVARNRAGFESDDRSYPRAETFSGRRYPDPDTDAYRHPSPDANANAVPGTFTDAHVDSGSHTYCDANANSHGSGDTDTRAVFNAAGYTNTYNYCDADWDRHADCNCHADCDCHAEAYA
jgi:hypothetical protein